jgi:trigger factor
MVSEVARRKALASVLEKAVITDASGTTIDLESLFPAEEEEPTLVTEAEAQAAVDQGGGAAPAAVPSSSDPTAVQAFDLGGFEPSEPVAPAAGSGDKA